MPGYYGNLKSLPPTQNLTKSYHMMSIKRLMLLLPLAGVALMPACSRAPASTEASPMPALQLSTEDIVVLRADSTANGPVIIGSVQPERRADLRAEVSAVVEKVLRENGDQVKQGDVLVQLDDTAIRDSLASAEAASRTAALALDQARRQLDRQHTLRTSGMTTAQALEDAEARHNNAVSEVEAAKARVVSARQQLSRTVVRAPFAGVVSDRKVSAGDTAQSGKELLKVVDPASLRFEGLVSSDEVGIVNVGQTVSFRVNGYGDKRFAGKIRRVNPVANAATRQVEVLVDFIGTDQPRLAGLYAEGRIETGGRASVMIPAASLLREGNQSYVWTIQNGKLARTIVSLGRRDERSGDFPVTTGLGEGARLLRHPSGKLSEGQPVQEPAVAPGSGA